MLDSTQCIQHLSFIDFLYTSPPYLPLRAPWEAFFSLRLVLIRFVGNQGFQCTTYSNLEALLSVNRPFETTHQRHIHVQHLKAPIKMQFLDNTILYTILGLAGGTMAVQYCCTSGCGICIKTPCGIYDSGCMGPIVSLILCSSYRTFLIGGII